MFTTINYENSRSRFWPGNPLHDMWQILVQMMSMIRLQDCLSRGELQEVLGRNMQELHHYLLETTEYGEMIEHGFSNLVRNKYLGWRTLYEDDIAKAGVVSAYRETPLPLHNHPGVEGVIMVLEGEVEVEQYTLAKPYCKDRSILTVELEPYSKVRLAKDDIAWFVPDTGNVHGVKALTERCVMLKVQMPPSRVDDRSWFFPLLHQSDDGKVWARRITCQFL